MLIIISPAKTLSHNSWVKPDSLSSKNSFCASTNRLLQHLKSYSCQELEKILGVSAKLAQVNFERYKNFESADQKQAFYAYDGDVYKNIQRDNLSDKQIDYISKHLRIISAFYGVLKAFDSIKPYRLEMSARLAIVAPKGLNIFWQNVVTDLLQEELKCLNKKIILNLASNEYSAAINRKKLDAAVIDVFFLEKKADKLQNIAVNAKRARGMLLNYMIQHQSNNPKTVKEFTENGYKFDPKLSDELNYYFIRDIK
jgi:cytoplasmic iron level regulating protein YaaA (DUF328/UPF0246 family)